MPDGFDVQEAAGDVAESTSVELTQSSCWKEAICNGGISALIYSISSVVSEDIPFAVKYSSIEVRRKVPLIRNSNGTGFSFPRRLFTNVDSAYLRKPVEHYIISLNDT